MRHDSQTTLEQIKHHLRDAYGDRLVGLVLFGSRARGDAHVGSDHDIWAVIRGLQPDLVERDEELRRCLFEARLFGVNVLAQTPEEVERNLRSLHLEIGLDGQVLYDPAGWIAQHLAVLRRRIAEAGLWREKRRGRWTWQWQTRPKRSVWAIEW
jgi:predicted nucleotidyltransferase